MGEQNHNLYFPTARTNVNLLNTFQIYLVKIISDTPVAVLRTFETYNILKLRDLKPHIVYKWRTEVGTQNTRVSIVTHWPRVCRLYYRVMPEKYVDSVGHTHTHTHTHTQIILRFPPPKKSEYELHKINMVFFSVAYLLLTN
jgi:hypothetical protein